MAETILQIWEKMGRRTPLAVKRDSWPIDNYVVIENVEFENTEKAKAFGFPVINGNSSNQFEGDPGWQKTRLIPGCNDSNWELVIVNFKPIYRLLKSA